VSPYGASKLAAEAYGSAFAGSYDLPFIALRFANVYGPYSYHKGSVVAKFFKDYLQREPWTVYGDGSQTRDFVYVGDLCRGIQQALELQVSGFSVFNLGSGTETSVNELIALMRQTTGASEHGIRFEPPRQGEIYRNYTKITKAQEQLGYSPSVSLADGLAETWRWFRQAEL
jgi:UDP-glucose 4-epimerase